MDNRHSVLRAARLRVKSRPGEDRVLMFKQLKEVAKDVKAVGGTIRGSPFERGKYVHTLRGLQTVLGLPSIWLTSECFMRQSGVPR